MIIYFYFYSDMSVKGSTTFLSFDINILLSNFYCLSIIYFS